MGRNSLGGRQCNRCGKPFVWKRLTQGWRPFNPDNTPHVKTCIPDENYIKESYRFIESKVRKIHVETKPIQIGKDEYI